MMFPLKANWLISSIEGSLPSSTLDACLIIIISSAISAYKTRWHTSVTFRSWTTSLLEVSETVLVWVVAISGWLWNSSIVLSMYSICWVNIDALWLISSYILWTIWSRVQVFLRRLIVLFRRFVRAVSISFFLLHEAFIVIARWLPVDCHNLIERIFTCAVLRSGLRIVRCASNRWIKAYY